MREAQQTASVRSILQGRVTGFACRTSMDYIEQIRTLFDLPPGKNYGYPEAEIAKAELRLGAKLPEVLRRYYLCLAGHRGINAGESALLYKPDELVLSDDGSRVIFCWHDDTTVSAVDLNAAAEAGAVGPKVWYSENDFDTEQQEWFVEAGSIAGFLLYTAWREGVSGGLPYYAAYTKNHAVETGLVKTIENNWREITGTGIYPNQAAGSLLRFFTSDYKEILILSKGGKTNALRICAGTGSGERFKTIREKINIPWDYIHEDPVPDDHTNNCFGG